MLQVIANGLHLHFVPSERNDHVPHVLKHHVLAGYSLILLLVKAVVFASYILLPASSVFSSAVTADNVIELTNASRKAVGLALLTPEGRLAKAATQKAEDMAANSYFSHASPSGVRAWSLIKSQGYRYAVAGENLAVHYVDAESLQDGWMASPKHRANILDDRFSDIGVGIARGTYKGHDATFVAQMFGTPARNPEAAGLTVPEGDEPEPVAKASAIEVFAPTETRAPFKLFGIFEITGLEDAVRRFYLTITVLLGLAIVGHIFIKYEVQRHSHTAHAALVMVLAVILGFTA